jgi:hypothetical protein
MRSAPDGAIRAAGSCCRFVLPVRAAGSCCRFMPPVRAAGSCCRFMPPVRAAGSCRRFVLPVHAADAFRFMPVRATRPVRTRGMQANLCMLPVDPASAFAFCMHATCIPNARLNAFRTHAKYRRCMTPSAQVASRQTQVCARGAIEME